MNTRILPLEPPYTDSVQADFDTIMPKGMAPLAIFRTVAHNPRVLHRMVRGGLLDKGSISIAERELVILRTCALCKAEYEWGVHVSGFSKVAGFSSKQIEDTVRQNYNETLWSEDQQLLLRLADQLHFTNTLEQSLWDDLSARYDSAQLIELCMLAGLYHSVSFVVNACKVKKEPFAVQFPDK